MKNRNRYNLMWKRKGVVVKRNKKNWKKLKRKIDTM